MHFWHVWGGWSKEGMENYTRIISEILVQDLAESGLFATVVTNPAQEADFTLELESKDVFIGDRFAIQITSELIKNRDVRLIARRNFEEPWGTNRNVLPTEKGRIDQLRTIMTRVKESVVTDMQGCIREQQEAAAQAEAVKMESFPLAKLVVASDPTLALARVRNHALISTKTRLLPGMLRSASTEELTSLVVQIEQAILDLNHACEMAKDQTQQAAAGEPAAQPEDASGASKPAPDLATLRDFTISYRERIELLKPILTSLKEEIANRSR